MKDIPGYEDLYSIDENGNVFGHRYQRFLKPNMDNYGYLKIGLTDVYGKRKTYTIHKLVALTYIPNPNNLPVVDHIDRNRLNNSVENLRWATFSENSLNKDWEQIYETYFNTPEIRKERTQKANQARCRPVEMRDKYKHDVLIKTYPSGKQAALQEFGDLSKSSGISECANGKRKSAHGYFWTFVPINTDVSCDEET